MPEKSKYSNHFNQSIPELGDEEIIKILKLRKHYQPEAARSAISEAIKRGIINSEQDLFDKQFDTEPVHRKIFPEIENENARNKTIKSISRALLLVGILPVVWGFLKVNEKHILEGAVLLLFGVLWVFSSASYRKKVNFQLIWLQLILLHFAAAYVVKILIDLKISAIMDFVIPGVLYLFIGYGLFYLRKLGK